MQNKMMMTIWGLIFYIIYLIFLSLVAADIRDNQSNAIYENFKNMYDRDTFTLNTGVGSHVATSVRVQKLLDPLANNIRRAPSQTV
jgi:hypothetical protein